MALGNTRVATRQEIDLFLRSVERRALQMTKMATRYHDDALDIVQDCMIKWTRLYHAHDPALWQMLFFKVLQSRLTDWHRRQTVARKIFFWRDTVVAGEDEDVFDNMPDTTDTSPEQHLEFSQMSRLLTKVIEKLPLRQQQVFMLRQWEGLSVTETATALGISEGSVKTHLSRALDTLRDALARLTGAKSTEGEKT